MQSFEMWQIEEALKTPGTEFLSENAFAIRTEGRPEQILPGSKIYKVKANDEAAGTVTLEDENGKEFTCNQADLARTMEEDSGPTGFQALQYPLGSILATAGTDLAKLAIYDARLKNMKEKPAGKKKA